MDLASHQHHLVKLVRFVGLVELWTLVETVQDGSNWSGFVVLGGFGHLQADSNWSDWFY